MGSRSPGANPAEVVTGHGDDPMQALHGLAVALRERPSPEDMRAPAPTP